MKTVPKHYWRSQEMKKIYTVQNLNNKYYILIDGKAMYSAYSINNIIYQLNELRIKEIKDNIKINLDLS